MVSIRRIWGWAWSRDLMTFPPSRVGYIWSFLEPRLQFWCLKQLLDAVDMGTLGKGPETVFVFYGRGGGLPQYMNFFSAGRRRTREEFRFHSCKKKSPIRRIRVPKSQKLLNPPWYHLHVVFAELGFTQQETKKIKTQKQAIKPSESKSAHLGFHGPV